MGLLSFLNPLEHITKALTDAYAAREKAKNDTERLRADVEIKNLEARRDVVIAAAVNDRWWSPRNLMGWSVAIYVFKLVVWDTVFGLGVTPDPGEQVTLIVMTVVGFYFVSKGAEVVANTMASVISGRARK